jgi:hypothetical protein
MQLAVSIFTRVWEILSELGLSEEDCVSVAEASLLLLSSSQVELSPQVATVAQWAAALTSCSLATSDRFRTIHSTEPETPQPETPQPDDLQHLRAKLGARKDIEALWLTGFGGALEVCGVIAML